jgi:transcriptional regulator with XRE-family HTH domain
MELNRLKVVLVEQKHTGKWLVEKLGKNEAAVSRWCTNESQPSLETLFAIVKALNVDVRKLLIYMK